MGAASDIEDEELDFEEEIGYGQNDNLSNPAAQTASASPDVDNLLNFASQCCEEFGLNDAMKDDVLKTCKLPLPFLLVRLYSRVLAFGKDVKKNTVDGFLESATFRNHILRQILCSLLDPTIPFYVQGTKNQFIEIPHSLQGSYINGKVFGTGISDNASSHRSDILRKLKKSIEGSIDIYTTCRNLYPPGYQCTKDHAQRILFIRMYLVEYLAKDNKLKFWEWVDAKLVKLRRKSKADQESSLLANFKKDKKKFPIPVESESAFPTVVRAQDWQNDISVAVLAMAREVEWVPRQRAPRSRPVAPTPAANSRSRTSTPDDRAIRSETEVPDNPPEDDRATNGTPSKFEDETPSMQNHQSLDGDTMDLDQRSAAPQPGHGAAGGQTASKNGELVGAMQNRNASSGSSRRVDPIGRASATPPICRVTNNPHRRSPAPPLQRAATSQSSSRFGTPGSFNGASGEEEQSFYNPLLSETHSATLGLG
ncbi:hypothetical protein RhiJN_24800 [Ceratobasidium sp. AG-Ba]|nr:hypothetical protein RhiJN_24800 [Ceratobasidium sp. AG-Ba]